MEKMKRVLFGALVIAVLASMVIGCGPGRDKIDLRYHLEQGKTYDVRVTFDMLVSQTLMGQTVDVDMTMGFGYSNYVREVDASGVASLDVTYNWIHVRMGLPGIEGGAPTVIEYDSDRPSDATMPETQAFSSLLGKGFSMNLSPTGEILKMEGVDRMMEQMLDEMPPGQDTESLRQQLRQQFNEQSLMGTLGGAFAIYPDHPVDVGDSWTKRVTLTTSGFPITLDNTWTLKERKDGVVTIEVHSELDPSQGAMSFESEGMTFNLKLSGEQKGIMEVDEATGWTIYGELHQDFSGEIDAMGMSWPITLTSTALFESSGK